MYALGPDDFCPDGATCLCVWEAAEEGHAQRCSIGRDCDVGEHCAHYGRPLGHDQDSGPWAASQRADPGVLMTLSSKDLDPVRIACILVEVLALDSASLCDHLAVRETAHDHRKQYISERVAFHRFVALGWSVVLVVSRARLIGLKAGGGIDGGRAFEITGAGAPSLGMHRGRLQTQIAHSCTVEGDYTAGGRGARWHISLRDSDLTMASFGA